jgi:hypothetical protein
MTAPNNKHNDDLPKGLRGSRALRVLLNIAGGGIPFGGGVLSAAAGAWSEQEQEKVNNFFQPLFELIKAEMAEKAQTILEITARLDMHDKAIAERVASPEYQSLVNKALRDWAGTESRKKREFVRNILVNAAVTRVTSDDVIRLFLQWLVCTANCISPSLHQFTMTKGVRARGYGKKSGKKKYEKIPPKPIYSSC